MFIDIKGHIINTHYIICIVLGWEDAMWADREHWSETQALYHNRPAYLVQLTNGVELVVVEGTVYFKRIQELINEPGTGTNR